MTTAVASSAESSNNNNNHDKLAETKQRLQGERQKVWDDLARAETCISDLLKEVSQHGLFDPDSLRESQLQSRRLIRAAKKKVRQDKADIKAEKADAKAAAKAKKANEMDIDGEDDDDDDDDDVGEDEDEESDESQDDDDDDDSLTSDGDNNNNDDGTNNNASAAEAAAAKKLARMPSHERYSKILSEIHSLCAPHAHWIQAYRPLTAMATTTTTAAAAAKKKKKSDATATANSNKPKISMYQARVEMRLAQEKQAICQEWLRLEQQELDTLEQKQEQAGKTDASSNANVAVDDRKKRKLEDVQ